MHTREKEILLSVGWAEILAVKHWQKLTLPKIPFLITDNSYLNFLALVAALVVLGCSRSIFKRLPRICKFFFFSAASSSSSSAFEIFVSARRKIIHYFFLAVA